MAQNNLHRASWDAEKCGYLLRTLAFDVEERDQDLLLLGQASEQFGGTKEWAQGILLIHAPDGTGLESVNGSTVKGSSQSL